MSYIVHQNENRGRADHGWLQARHSFSFGSWQDPRYMGVSALRVINEDRIAGHRGFGMHSHDNMEILTYVMSGQLTHKDSMGNIGHLAAGSWQLMSAGTGVTHSEMNESDEPVHLLQIWLFSNITNPAPNYQELVLDIHAQPNQWHLIVASEENAPDHFSNLIIRQDARILAASLQADHSLNLLATKNNNYLHIISGKVSLSNDKETKELSTGDALSFDHFTAQSTVTAESDAQLLWFELP
jgi:redox-sensitive bicupin YhaK (pirin superfamily)